jgi:hypothetical protein
MDLSKLFLRSSGAVLRFDGVDLQQTDNAHVPLGLPVQSLSGPAQVIDWVPSHSGSTLVWANMPGAHACPLSSICAIGLSAARRQQ